MDAPEIDEGKVSEAKLLLDKAIAAAKDARLFCRSAEVLMWDSGESGLACMVEDAIGGIESAIEDIEEIKK